MTLSIFDHHDDDASVSGSASCVTPVSSRSKCHDCDKAQESIRCIKWGTCSAVLCMYYVPFLLLQCSGIQHLKSFPLKYGHNNLTVISYILFGCILVVVL